MDYHIHIQDLTLEAWVGIHPHEATYQPIILNIDLSVSSRLGDKYDMIEYTVNYEEIILKIKKLLVEKKFRLLETLAYHIGEVVLTYPQVMEVEVIAGKPHLLGSKQISVIIKRKKDSI